MSRAVHEIILAPMREMYPPPLHLRQDREAQGRALAAYERALGRFDAATLARAWDEVVARQAYWVWPNPGVIAEACRRCEPRDKPPSEEEQRQAAAREMADEYVGRYMKTSQVAKLAKREGWSGRLREYVHDTAQVQAQLICRVRHIGWNARLSDGLGRFGSSEEAFAAYRPTIEEQVRQGRVGVRVPRARIKEWKEEGRGRLPSGSSGGGEGGPGKGAPTPGGRRG